MTTVALCIPSGDRWHAGFALDVAKLVGATAHEDPALALAVLNVRGSILPQVRSTLAAQALTTGADYLFWLDSDMRFPKDALVRLLARETPVVGCNYATRQPPILPSAQRQGERVFTTPTSQGLEAVEWMGFGCLLIAQEVFARMDRPWFAFGYARADDGFVGEDYYWFQKARALGYQPVLDHDLSKEIYHLAEVPFSNAHAATARDAEFTHGTG